MTRQPYQPAFPRSEKTLRPWLTLTEAGQKILRELTDKLIEARCKTCPRTTTVSLELLDREPPNNQEAERAVLGSCLLDARMIVKVSGVLTFEDFYGEANRIVWRRMTAMSEKSEAVDAVTVAAALKKHGELKDAGGAAYLAEVLHSVPVANHAVSYARIVAKQSAWRRMIGVGIELIRRGYEAIGEPVDVSGVIENGQAS